MKWLILLCVCALLIAGCEDSTGRTNKRFVEQQRFDTPIPALDKPEQAVQTEAVIGSMRSISQQLKLKLASTYAGDFNRLSTDFSGRMDATKLSKLGMTEAQLTGSFYKPTDFSLSFSGRNVTITAMSPGQRGYTQQSYIIN